MKRSHAYTTLMEIIPEAFSLSGSLQITSSPASCQTSSETWQCKHVEVCTIDVVSTYITACHVFYIKFSTIIVIDYKVDMLVWSSNRKGIQSCSIRQSSNHIQSSFLSNLLWNVNTWKCVQLMLSAYSTVCHSKYCHRLQGGSAIRMYWKPLL